MKKQILGKGVFKYWIGGLLLFFIIWSSCKSTETYNQNSIPTKEFSPDLVIEWWDLVYDVVAYERIKPPVASRIYAYLGVAVYEALLPGMLEYAPLEESIEHLPKLPRPDPESSYDWLTVMVNTLYLVIDEVFSRFVHTDEPRFLKLRGSQLQSCQERLGDPAVFKRSVAYGEVLSKALLEWMKADNFDDTRFYSFYTIPSRNDNAANWEPTDANLDACEPFWDAMRPFVLESGEQCHIDLPVPFSSEVPSAFHEAVQEVLKYDKNLTEEERDIAFHWADDPGETSTPPGHWTSIMNQAALQSELNLEQAAVMYATVGIGIADAFIASWYSKYKVNLLRPKTYIHDYIPERGHWEPLVETPPFPEYTSAHAVVSTVAAETLTQFFGEGYELVDSTHVGIGLPPRKIKDFRTAAQEAGMSRLYGGIHYKFSIDAGFEQGRCVSSQINQHVQLRKDGKNTRF